MYEDRPILNALLKKAYGHLGEGPVTTDPGNNPVANADPRENLYRVGLMGKVLDGRGKRSGEPNETRAPKANAERNKAEKIWGPDAGTVDEDPTPFKGDPELRDNEDSLSEGPKPVPPSEKASSASDRYIQLYLEKVSFMRTMAPGAPSMTPPIASAPQVPPAAGPQTLGKVAPSVSKPAPVTRPMPMQGPRIKGPTMSGAPPYQGGSVLKPSK